MCRVVLVAVACAIAQGASAAPFNDRFGAAPSVLENAVETLERENGTTEGRAVFARQYEESLLAQGVDMHASTAGVQNRTLFLQWIGFSRPIVYQLLNKTGFLARMKRYGFDHIEITDGEAAIWRFRRSGATYVAY